MVYSAISDIGGTISEFIRYEDITLSHTGALTAYQKRLTIPYQIEMQTDFDDFRFNIWNGTAWAYVPYWIEFKTDSTTADVWIKNDYDSGDTVVRMYYGNSSLSDGGVGSDVFLHYNDATSLTDWTGSGTSIFSGKLRYLDTTSSAPLAYYAHGESLPDDVITEIKANLTEYGTEDFAMFVTLDGGVSTDRFSQMILGETANNYTTVDTTVIASPLVQDAYKIHQMTLRKTDVKVDYAVLSLDRSVDGSIVDKTYPVGSPSTYSHIGLFSGSSGKVCDARFDWFIVRAYTATEPTYTIGTPRHQRRTPRYM